MCETTIYLEKNGEKIVVMSDVVSLTVKNDHVEIRDLFGETKKVKGKVKNADFLNHFVVLTEK